MADGPYNKREKFQQENDMGSNPRAWVQQT